MTNNNKNMNRLQNGFEHVIIYGMSKTTWYLPLEEALLKSSMAPGGHHVIVQRQYQKRLIDLHSQ